MDFQHCRMCSGLAEGSMNSPKPKPRGRTLESKLDKKQYSLDITATEAQLKHIIGHLKMIRIDVNVQEAS